MRTFDMPLAMAAHIMLAVVGLAIIGAAAGLVVMAGAMACLTSFGRKTSS